MTSKIQPFGGFHTKRKLDVVASYLASYVTVMKKKNFQLHYVDGFAGSGASTNSGADSGIETGLFDIREIVEGSPIRALDIDPPFDHYLFIDSNASNIVSLRTVINAHKNGTLASVKTGDANEEIERFCDWLDQQSGARAVVFLDPFGLAVRWETVSRLAATGKVDLWYLVPADGMLNRLMHVWIGTSVENDEVINRIESLATIEGMTLFISFEPLIGAIGNVDLAKIHWAIVGGESGPRSRPIQSAWVDEIHSLCRRDDVAFFFKQWGGKNKKAAGRELHGQFYDEYPIELEA